MVTNSAKILVIVPTRNENGRIQETLRSLQTQSVVDWIVFIGDNASTDGTQQTVSDAAGIDTRVRYHFFKDFVDVNTSFMRCADMALAEIASQYVCFLGGDDIYLGNDYLGDLLQSFNGADLAIPHVQEISSSGALIRESNIYNLSKLPGLNLARFLLDPELGNAHYGLFTRSWFEELIANNDTRWREGDLASDWWFALGAFMQRPGRIIRVRTATYRKMKFDQKTPEGSRYYGLYETETKVSGNKWLVLLRETLRYAAKIYRKSSDRYPGRPLLSLCLYLAWILVPFSQIIRSLKRRIS